MKTLMKKLTYAAGAVAFGMSVSTTTVQADVVMVNPTNLSCENLESILTEEEGWETVMQTLLQVAAANQYGTAVVENGGSFQMMCNGSEILHGNTLKSLTAIDETGAELDMEPIYVEFQVTSDVNGSEELEVTIQGDTVFAEITTDDAVESNVNARRRYRARLRFRGRVRSR